jgi:hypothetical protein
MRNMVVTRNTVLTIIHLLISMRNRIVTRNAVPTIIHY